MTKNEIIDICAEALEAKGVKTCVYKDGIYVTDGSSVTAMVLVTNEQG